MRMQCGIARSSNKDRWFSGTPFWTCKRSQQIWRPVSISGWYRSATHMDKANGKEHLGLKSDEFFVRLSCGETCNGSLFFFPQKGREIETATVTWVLGSMFVPKAWSDKSPLWEKHPRHWAKWDAESVQRRVCKRCAGRLKSSLWGVKRILLGDDEPKDDGSFWMQWEDFAVFWKDVQVAWQPYAPHTLRCADWKLCHTAQGCGLRHKHPHGGNAGLRRRDAFFALYPLTIWSNSHGWRGF